MLLTPILLSLTPANLDPQVLNPATAQHAPTAPGDQSGDRLRSWELPPSVVEGERWSPFRDSDLIGDYGQPRWTSRRLFPTTRVYVMRPGQFDFEFWQRVKTPKRGPSTVETQYEFEVGLPGRFQFDYYLVTERSGSDGTTDISEVKYELRYALADWGKLPWNPTLYAEWKSVSGGPDGYEAKLLLGDEVAPGWRVGANLVYERNVSGDLANEYQVTMGVSRTIIDEKFSLGAELRASLTDVHGDRGDFEKELEIGPSLQWRPVPNMHIDFAPLVGIGSDSRRADIFFVMGWEF
ncbi:MAG: transporter [Planctomycetes bacterium]|nr:transporter [Planctomycetota bacterium]